MDPVAVVGVLVMGTGMLVAGGLAYAGVWRSWVASPELRSRTYSGLGLAYGGAGFLLGLLVIQFDSSVIGIALALVAVAGIWIFLVSLLWLPTFVRPLWLRAWEDRGSNPMEFARRR